ncbi:hypothetical protein [Bradyrhizobium sp. th.b2]|uniref:hypothetical protein n=1 Tax=Bradyrhizobium sp. th-b2 TaxID=172088 RepID=UPI000406CC9C|nr:hypothetical protein [Bradyrhizobium sp. th.b2]
MTARWRYKLTPYDVDGIVIFGRDFLQRWGNQAWPSHDDPAGADDITAATKLHVQLVSRISTQRLPYADGVEAAALISVYQLFGEGREIFMAHSRSRLVDAISWHVLNTHVRPFTAKWHRQSERGALSALDATDIFRDDLYTLQQKLTRFDALLMEIRDGLAPPSALVTAESEDESRIADEMGEDVEWHIDEKLGGLREEMAAAINAEEKKAVTARRHYYRPLPVAHETSAQTDTRSHATQSQGALPAEASVEEAWRSRPHAVALAISGGGIRSATFALGVLVALARRNLLYQFDYLSTVSGEGIWARS